jgi:hypothetical protein
MTTEKEKHPGGRPPKYKTVDEMQKVIDRYFIECDQTETPYTITGLAMALDMTRDQIIRYTDKDEFRDAIKRAKQKVENAYELRLVKQGRAGDIFALKNFGWIDRQEVESTNHNLNEDLDKLTKEERGAKIAELLGK